MAAAAEEANDVEKLYEHGERLNEAKDKTLLEEDYEGIIAAANGSMKAKQLAAQLIPRFFKYFPNLGRKASCAHFDLCEEDELAIRIQAIRGLPLLCKDSPDYISDVMSVLGQLLLSEENVERDAVQKSIMSILRQDTKASLTSLFKHVESSDENVREKVIGFIKDKLFPLKAELLRPQEQMERHVTDLIKNSLQDVTSDEFKMFMDFLKSLKLFGENAPPERVQELIGIIEGQADLDAQFNVSDIDHVVRLMTCMTVALPIFARGASNKKFLNYLSKHIIPVFEKVPDKSKVDLLRNLAESAPYTASQDARHFLPSVVQLLKKYMPLRKGGEEMHYTYIECLLYTFHHLAHKVPNATNNICGYKIVTGQPSDRLGEDFSEQYKDFTERLTNVEDLTRGCMKKLTQGMSELNKAMASAKTEDEKIAVKAKKLSTTTELRTCNNILTMTHPLHSKAPNFIGDKKINLSWKEATKSSAPSAASSAGSKRAATATNGSGPASMPNKKGRGQVTFQNQLVNRALEGISRGGGRGGRGRGGRGRGRGYRLP